MKIRGIIFDMDDTLVAFDAVTDKSWEEVCKKYEQKNPSLKWNKLFNTIKLLSNEYWKDPERHRIGRNNIEEVRRNILKKVFIKLGIKNQEDAVYIADEYSKVRLNNMYLFPETISVLEKLKKKNYTLLLMTNGDNKGQRDKIKKFCLEKYFNHILIEGELGYDKPDDRIFKKATNLINLKPEHIMIVGDNFDWEILPGKNYGFKAVWINKRNIPVDNYKKKTADAIIYNLNELYDYL